jgi:hypothetical protein
VSAVSNPVSVGAGSCQMTIVKSNPWTYTITIQQLDLVMSINIMQYLTVTLAIDSQVRNSVHLICMCVFFVLIFFKSVAFLGVLCQKLCVLFLCFDPNFIRLHEVIVIIQHGCYTN